MNITIIGSDGQIGRRLLTSLAPLGSITALTRSQLDLSDLNAIEKTLANTKPDIIVNAAAYTDVDGAEDDRDTAARINAEAPSQIALAADSCGAVLVHYSTDYVFDGTSPRPYLPDDATNPLSVYGTTKRDGERAILAIDGASQRSLIFRTSWIYDNVGSNFLLTMQRLASRLDTLQVVNDQHGAPTFSKTIADATAAALAQTVSGEHGARCLGVPGGIYHLTCTGETTWFGFASAIIDHGPTQPTIEPVTSDAFPRPAHRPSNSRLDLTKTIETFELSLPSWQEAMTECLQESSDELKR
ncbi:MAG: dTDP-4-dehydrorhamnose reductase [Phycisphaerales bacterium]|nr:dTDP-4-dehydrorhamnose reductase [Phycisphaerales bacterium]